MLEKPVRADQSKDNAILWPIGESKRDKNGRRVYKRHRRYRPRKQKNSTPEKKECDSSDTESMQDSCKRQEDESNVTDDIMAFNSVPVQQPRKRRATPRQ